LESFIGGDNKTRLEKNHTSPEVIVKAMRAI